VAVSLGDFLDICYLLSLTIDRLQRCWGHDALDRQGSCDENLAESAVVGKAV
jgi:hypothetical protein